MRSSPEVRGGLPGRRREPVVQEVTQGGGDSIWLPDRRVGILAATPRPLLRRNLPGPRRLDRVPPVMPHILDPSHDLLFGLLALQIGLIDQGRLVAPFQARTLDKVRALADH